MSTARTDDGHSGTTPSAATTGDVPDDEASDDEPEPVGEPAYRPPTLSTAVAALGVLLAVAAVATGSVFGAAAAAMGLPLALVGVVRGWPRVVTAGAAIVFGGVLVGGLYGVGPAGVLFGAVGAAIAYDAGTYAVGLGQQVRAGARTTAAEVLHLGATLAVASGAAAVGYLGFLIGAGGQPVAALVALLLGAFVLAWVLQS